MVFIKFHLNKKTMNNQIEFEPKYNFPGNVLRQKARAIFLYATAVFLIMNALLSCKSNTASQSQDQNKIDSLSIAKDTLQSQFNAARIQIDNDATKSAILDSMIQRKDLARRLPLPMPRLHI